jgi:hypothetical protein
MADQVGDTLADANVGVRERITETAIFLSTERP